MRQLLEYLLRPLGHIARPREHVGHRPDGLGHHPCHGQHIRHMFIINSFARHTQRYLIARISDALLGLVRAAVVVSHACNIIVKLGSLSKVQKTTIILI